MKKIVAALLLLVLAAGTACAGENRVAFSRQVGDKIFLFWANADGTNVTKAAEANEGELSPDGTQIAFTFHEAGGQYIAVYDIASKETRVIRNVLTNQNSCAGWSPDGSKLLFTEYQSKLWRPGYYDFDVNKPAVIMTAKINMAAPFWSGDGESLYALDDQFQKIYRYSAATGKRLEEIPASRLAQKATGASICDDTVRFHSSADGKALLFTMPMSKEKCPVCAKFGDGNDMKRAVFLYYLGSGRTVRVTPPDYCVNSAAWAAGGKIVFSAHMAVAGNSGTSNLYRMALGGKPELVVKDAMHVSLSR